MDSLVIAHVVVAVVLLASAVAVGVWGLGRAAAIARDGRESRWFAHVLQASHTLVLATCLVGGALYLEGYRVADPLHVRVYGPFMVVAIVAAYGYRTTSAVRNVRVFSVASMVIVALGLRAFFTGE